MTDRELLEHAAEVAGYDYEVRGTAGIIYLAKTNDEGRQFYSVIWNPRADDGDALRLLCAIWSKIKDPRVKFAIHQALDSGDSNQARRAVVHAAAAIEAPKL